MCCVMPPNSRSATLVVRIASRSDVLPWSTCPITVTTGGRGRRWIGSLSSSSRISPSSERTSRSKWNLSATRRAAVGSSTSFSVAITPSSSSALITSPDLRRIAAASSPTVTDSGTLISSRLISCGGSGSATTTGLGCGRLGGTTTGAGRGGGAGTAGRGRTAGGAGAAAAGRPGVGGTGGTRRLGAGGPGGLTSVTGGGATAAGRTGITGGGAGAGFGGTTTGGAGGGAATTGSGGAIGAGAGGASTVGAGVAEGRKIVAVGLAVSTGGSIGSSTLVTFNGRGGRFGAASFSVSTAVDATATSGTSSAIPASRAFTARFGLTSGGNSRPRPSLTRSSFAVTAVNGLIARMPLWPIPSRATTRSLLVTPSSFARSMTFTRPATLLLPPPPGFQDLSRALARRPHAAPQRACQTSGSERLLQALGRRAGVGAAARRSVPLIHDHTSIVPQDQPQQLRLRSDLPAPDTSTSRISVHSEDARGTGSTSTSPTAEASPAGLADS